MQACRNLRIKGLATPCLFMPGVTTLLSSSCLDAMRSSIAVAESCECSAECSAVEVYLKVLQRPGPTTQTLEPKITHTCSGCRFQGNALLPALLETRCQAAAAFASFLWTAISFPNSPLAPRALADRRHCPALKLQI